MPKIYDIHKFGGGILQFIFIYLVKCRLFRKYCRPAYSNIEVGLRHSQADTDIADFHPTLRTQRTQRKNRRYFYLCVLAVASLSLRQLHPLQTSYLAFIA